jgi:hypothetical protein
MSDAVTGWKRSTASLRRNTKHCSWPRMVDATCVAGRAPPGPLVRGLRGARFLSGSRVGGGCNLKIVARSDAYPQGPLAFAIRMVEYFREPPARKIIQRQDEK